jgi:hypothetical protein
VALQFDTARAALPKAVFTHMKKNTTMENFLREMLAFFGLSSIIIEDTLTP